MEFAQIKNCGECSVRCYFYSKINGQCGCSNDLAAAPPDVNNYIRPGQECGSFEHFFCSPDFTTTPPPPEDEVSNYWSNALAIGGCMFVSGIVGVVLFKKRRMLLARARAICLDVVVNSVRAFWRNNFPGRFPYQRFDEEREPLLQEEVREVACSSAQDDGPRGDSNAIMELNNESNREVESEMGGIRQEDVEEEEMDDSKESESEESDSVGQQDEVVEEEGFHEDVKKEKMEDADSKDSDSVGQQYEDRKEEEAHEDVKEEPDDSTEEEFLDADGLRNEEKDLGESLEGVQTRSMTTKAGIKI